MTPFHISLWETQTNKESWLKIDQRVLKISGNRLASSANRYVFPFRSYELLNLKKSFSDPENAHFRVKFKENEQLTAEMNS